VISVPLAWSWRLSDATPAQRANWELIGDGYGVHWPDVDEAWASICWLTVPYLGAYPNVPALIAKGLLFKFGPVETVAEELTLHLANFLIWPLLGWSVVRAHLAIMRHRHQSGAGPQHRPAPQCESAPSSTRASSSLDARAIRWLRRSTASVRIWLILIEERFVRPVAWLSSVRGNPGRGSWLVKATAMTGRTAR
jgi:hypothetical protein